LVTPIISMEPLKPGTKDWRAQQAAEAAARRLSNLTGSKLNDEKLLQQMEEKKRLVGPALTKAGSILFTEERRRNFLDDEDFFEVVNTEGAPAYPPE
jgi:predicted HTH transcriptional regulator